MYVCIYIHIHMYMNHPGLPVQVHEVAAVLLAPVLREVADDLRASEVIVLVLALL